MTGEPPGALIGRAAEGAAIRRMLGGARLVTVTGPPGVGKTAVSLAAASAAARCFADGSLLLRLDTLLDEVLLPHTVAAALRLPDEFTRSPLEMLTGQLRDRHLLLVLDTCEHLLGACAALVAAMLPSCPRLHVLATSREPLRVPGETTMRMRPLRLADAVELFGLRAAQAGAETAAQNRAAQNRAAQNRAVQNRATQNRAVMASICVQLDKLPLAIELAAADLAETGERLAVMLARLETGQHLPGPAGEPGRHRTMRAAIGWSHELCTPSERLLWARLSVFAGSFGPRDAADVCAGEELPAEAVAAGLSLLTERSLLLADQQGDGGPRFLLPVTLRAYGHQMLRRLGQDEEFAARHKRWQDGRRPHQDAPAGK
jgi:predicted ATPase